MYGSLDEFLSLFLATEKGRGALREYLSSRALATDLRQEFTDFALPAIRAYYVEAQQVRTFLYKFFYTANICTRPLQKALP